MWRPKEWFNPYFKNDDGTMRRDAFEEGADAIITGQNEEFDLFFKRITNINFAFWGSSWGRLQCNAETADGKKYQSWAGRANEELSIEIILSSLRGISEQLK